MHSPMYQSHLGRSLSVETPKYIDQTGRRTLNLRTQRISLNQSSRATVHLPLTEARHQGSCISTPGISPTIIYHTYSIDQMAESDSSNNVVVDSSCAEIIIIRHGETEWNALRKMQGHLDVNLNEAGRQQARAVADWLSKEPNISAIYSSDLNRALETANIIAGKCGILQVIQDEDLRERHLGDLQGHVFQPQELMKICPQAYRAFMSNDKNQQIPGGGESINQLYQRCTSAIERIAGKHKGQRLIVVTHGGVIRSLYERSTSEGRPGRVLNTSVSLIQVKDGSNWSLEKWNDVSHLRRTEFLESAFGGDSTSG